MPHPLELTLLAHRQALYRMSVGQIRPVVRFIGRMLQRTGTHPGGAPIFGSNYVDVTLDISNRIQNGISLSLEKPRYPNDDEGGITISEINVDVINTDGYFAIHQDGSIIQAADVDNAEIQVFAQMEGVGALLPVYRGRVVGSPVESFGITSFVVRDIGWNIIKEPILHENLEGVTSGGGAVSITGTQSIAVDGLNLLVNTKLVQTPNGHIRFYPGLATFNAFGDPVVDVKNNDPDKAKLRTMTIKNGAKPGLYRIEFDTKRTYKLTYPDNSVYNGDILLPFESPVVDIPANSWIINNSIYNPAFDGSIFNWVYQNDIDATGVQIEFQVFYTVSGNPGTIIKNLIEKGMSGNVGSAPNTGSTAMPYTNIRVDWPAFDEMERRFSDVCVFVSETNKDNSVWERKTGNQPISWLRIAQRVADHVMSYIVIQPDGLLTVKMPFIDDRTIYELTTNESVLSHTINPIDRFNYLSVQYAFDTVGGSYLTASNSDLRGDPNYLESRHTINAPYFKAGISKRQAEWLRDTFIRHHYARQYSIECDVTPQMGLTLLPGDKVRFRSTVQPVIDTYCEVRQVAKGIGDTVKLDLTPIAPPEGEPFELCNSGFSGDLLF